MESDLMPSVNHYVGPNSCPKEEGWGWDLRVSCRLYDGSGSMKMVLTKDIASKVLQRNLAELVTSNSGQLHQIPPSSEITLKIPDTIDIIEAITDNNPSSYRSNDMIIISDGGILFIFHQMKRMNTNSQNM